MTRNFFRTNQYFTYQNFFADQWLKNFLDQIFFQTKILFWNRNFFFRHKICLAKFFWTTYFFGTKCFVWPNNIYLDKVFFYQILFLDKIFFAPKIFFGPKRFWTNFFDNFFGTKKIGQIYLPHKKIVVLKDTICISTSFNQDIFCFVNLWS